MKLVFALVDVAEPGHEDAYFPTQFLSKLSEVTIHQCRFRLIRKRRNALVYIQYPTFRHNLKYIILEMQRYDFFFE